MAGRHWSPAWLATLLRGLIAGGVFMAASVPAFALPPGVGATRTEAHGAQPACFPEARRDPSGHGILELRLDDVPVIVRSPAQISQRPVLLWHGFGPPDSEQALMQALPLDDVPAEKIYVGLPMFGRRLPPGGLSEIARRQSADYLVNLLGPVASGVADDLHRLYAALQRRGCVAQGEAIDAFGYSAGGFSILYAANEAAVPIARLVLLNAPTGAETAASVFEHATGRSYGWSEASREVARRLAPAALADPPSAFAAAAPDVLLLQGASDDAALREGASALDERLRPVYRGAHRDSDLQLRMLAGMGHGWLADPDLATVRSATADWYGRSRPRR